MTFSATKIQPFSCWLLPPDDQPTSDAVHLIRHDGSAGPSRREAYPQPYHLLMLVVAGTVVQTVDEQVCLLQAGELCYVRPGQVQGWTMDENTRAYLLFVRPTPGHQPADPGTYRWSLPPTDFRLGLLDRLFGQLHAVCHASGANRPERVTGRLRPLLGCLDRLLADTARYQPD